MRAVVIGATGATGKELLQLLLQDESVTGVTALVRKALPLQHDKLQVHVVDFDKPDQWREAVQGDVAFSCMGTTLKAAGSKDAQYKVDYGYQYAFAEAAKQNGVPKFILISAGMANSQSLVFYSQMKGELEQAVKALHFQGLVIFRPGLLLRPETDRAGERVSAALLQFFNRIGFFKKMAPLPVQQLAMLMLRYAKQAGADVQVISADRILKETYKGA